MPADSSTILEEIDQALNAWRALRAASSFDDCSDRPLEERVKVKERLAATLGRLAPRGSRHEECFRQATGSATPLSRSLATLVGALTALKSEHEATTPEEAGAPVDADPLAGVLEMARQIHDEGFGDAATVMAGGALAQHLRALCIEHGIEAAGVGYAETDRLNAELARHGVYDDQSRQDVVSWLGSWNDAVRGAPDDRTGEQVRELIDSITDFVTRHPA